MPASISSHLFSPIRRDSSPVYMCMRLGALVRGSGAGYVAGTYPNGLTSVGGAPTAAEVSAYARVPGSVLDGVFLGSTVSDSSGIWELDNLPLMPVDIVARLDGERDVIAPQVMPYTGTRTLYPHSNDYSVVPPPAITPSGYHWSTEAIYPCTSANPGWNGYTLRAVIPGATVPTSVGLRVSFAIPAGYTPGICGAAYVQKKASSGDPYDFSTTPVPLTVGGSSSFVIGGVTTTDTAALTLTSGDAIVISLYLSAGDAQVSTGLTGVNCYYISGNDASTTNTSGYTSTTAGYLYFVQQLDFLIP